MAEDESGEHKKARMEIKLDDEMAQGLYVNSAMLHHDETEFVIDMIYVQPHRRRATVRARIISSPKHTKRLLMALGEQIRRYEERFGSIEISGPGPIEKLTH
jgi:hypothetical protein